MTSKLPALKDMLDELVRCPSVSSTQPALDQSNRTIIELLANWCELVGMDVEISQVEGLKDKWNLVARTGPGNGGLVLSGHTDTVPYDEGAWQTDPFRLTEVDGCWYGLGVCDMKSFFPLALLAIEEAAPFLDKPITLVATANEESGMEGASHLVKTTSGLGDFVLIGEPTGLAPIHQHKGILMEEILVEGLSGHSSNPALGKNALEAMTDIILELRGLRQQWQQLYQNPGFEVPVPTLNLGCIHGGDNPNRICKSCRLQFDVRLMPGMEVEFIRQSISGILQPVSRRYGVDIQLNPIFGVESFHEPKASELVNLCESYTGRKASSVAFATEAAYFKSMGAQTVVLGPGDIDQAHQPNEYLKLDRIQPMQQLLRKLIRKLCVDTAEAAR
ncbi:acetylornithine deacetylase [Hahella sp. CCB-MM4]|uniref:acetylornithine deacetylase n=1 Tax=Hahella sp. (strain CCB-MM4) TaxID=1926491 RepID=UPI000B9B3F98|nr:acetylornithine deacetylase [Hahella sp. CCB-MM4]OZG74939.1 acetylornithine deacetylase [Hahella sp. CCB-MM4]